MAAPLIDVLAPLEDKAWFPDRPVAEADLAAAESALGRRLPDDHRDLLRAAGPGSVYGPESRVVLIPPAHLVQFNPDRERLADLTDMLVFADDGGDYFYFYDVPDRLGRGAWAVFAVEMSVATQAGSRWVARDLRHLIERILAGEAVIE